MSFVQRSKFLETNYYFFAMQIAFISDFHDIKYKQLSKIMK